MNSRRFFGWAAWGAGAVNLTTACLVENPTVYCIVSQAWMALAIVLWAWAPDNHRPDATAKARRIGGVVAMIGGKHKTRKRNATPLPFRDLLLDMARSAHDRRSDRLAA